MFYGKFMLLSITAFITSFYMSTSNVTLAVTTYNWNGGKIMSTSNVTLAVTTYNWNGGKIQCLWWYNFSLHSALLRIQNFYLSLITERNWLCCNLQSFTFCYSSIPTAVQLNVSQLFRLVQNLTSASASQTYYEWIFFICGELTT